MAQYAVSARYGLGWDMLLISAAGGICLVIGKDKYVLTYWSSITVSRR